jgi:hypothetical protein
MICTLNHFIQDRVSSRRPLLQPGKGSRPARSAAAKESVKVASSEAYRKPAGRTPGSVSVPTIHNHKTGPPAPGSVAIYGFLFATSFDEFCLQSLKGPFILFTDWL